MPLVEMKLLSFRNYKSPTFFENIRSIYLMLAGFQSGSSTPWAMTKKGLHVQLYVRPDLDSAEERYLAILDCFQHQGDLVYSEAHSGSVDALQATSPAIYLRMLWGDQYTRIRGHICDSVGERARYGGHHETIFVKQSPAAALPDLASMTMPDSSILYMAGDFRKSTLMSRGVKTLALSG